MAHHRDARTTLSDINEGNDFEDLPMKEQRELLIRKAEAKSLIAHHENMEALQREHLDKMARIQEDHLSRLRDVERHYNEYMRKG